MSESDTPQRFQSVWDAICDTPEKAAEMEARSMLLIALQGWAKRQSPNKATRQLGTTTESVRDLRGGRFSSFTLSKLQDLTTRAGLPPQAF